MFDTSTRRWTVRELMRVAIDFVGKKGIDESRLTVELLLAHALKRPRIQLYTDHDLPLGEAELQSFRALLKRRLAGEPVQYIVGEAHFMGMPFLVDPRVLVPRPETESLVEQVILFVRGSDHPEGLRLLDIGTGSGNIAISCAKLLPEIRCVAADSSEPAIRVASANAMRHGVIDRVQCVEWDMMRDAPEEWTGAFDVVVSNPPYIPLAEWERLDPLVRDNEPQRALTDGSTGLTCFRRLSELAPRLMKGEGPLMVEVGDGQATEVVRLMKGGGGQNVKVTSDLSRVPRIVTGNFSMGRLQ